MKNRSAWTKVIAVAAIVVAGAFFLWPKGLSEKDDPATPEPPPEPGMEVIEKSTAFYSERPYYEQPKPYTPTPEGLASLTAESCGACHQSIYEEWRISTHARAWLDDAQFQEELKKSRSDPPHEDNGDVGWLCVNCHTPLMNQLPELVVGLEDDDISKPIYEKNPFFDPELQTDAITCATCHVEDGVVLGPYGSKEAPHPVKKSETLLSEKVCTSCHQAQTIYVSQNLGCFFSTGKEWEESPAGKRGETCQSCHMPEIERHVADNFTNLPKRKTRRHWFGGSLIPKHPDYAEELEPLEEVYGDGVVLTARLGEGCEAEPCTRIVIDVANSRAGHHVPSGDPERHLEIVATATADDQEVARAEQWVGSRYEWWPEIKLVESNRIPAGETLTFYLDVERRPPFDVEVVADKFRMYEDAFEHHELEGRYVRGREFFRQRYRVVDGAISPVETDQPE